MEIAKIETDALEVVSLKHEEIQFRELADLELAMIGGGNGDIELG
jgi:hypothetical protein